MAKPKYQKSLPRDMYCFFRSYDDLGAPSVTKFAATVGMTTAELESFRSHKEFDRAYRECCEIKRDYLVDRALCKRFDPSFVKFLLSSDERQDEESDNFELTLTVSE